MLLLNAVDPKSQGVDHSMPVGGILLVGDAGFQSSGRRG